MSAEVLPPNNFRSGCVATLEFLPRVGGFAASWLIVVLIFVCCSEVVQRYLLGAPTDWGFEACTMLTGTHFLLGFAKALRENAHIRIDIFYGRMGPRSKRIVDLVSLGVFALPVSAAMVYVLAGYWHEAYLSMERTGQSAWNPVVWPFRVVFFLSFFLLLLQIFAELVKLLLPRTR